MSHITEVLRLESDVITLQDIFVARPPDEEASSHVLRLMNPLSATGLKPHFLDKMAVNGVVLPSDFFEHDDGVRPAFAAGSYGSFQ